MHYWSTLSTQQWISLPLCLQIPLRKVFGESDVFLIFWSLVTGNRTDFSEPSH